MQTAFHLLGKLGHLVGQARLAIVRRRFHPGRYFQLQTQFQPMPGRGLALGGQLDLQCRQIGILLRQPLQPGERAPVAGGDAFSQGAGQLTQGLELPAQRLTFGRQLRHVTARGELPVGQPFQ